MPSAWMPFVALFATALATSLAVTPLARKLAWAVGAIDYPSKRRINRDPIPRLGGVAVFAGILVSGIVYMWGKSSLGWPDIFAPLGQVDLNYLLIALAFGIVFATGLIDDVFQLKPLPKFLGQLLAAIVAVAGGLVIGKIVNPLVPGGEIDLGLFAYPITVIYLVAYVNIINLIDGLDGLATGITAISSITMFVLASNADRLDAAVLAIVVAGAALGFLGYNFNPATIFLGDSGSLVLGFALGTMSLLSVTRLAGLTTIIIPLLVAFIPIIDTLSAIVRRSRAHVSVSQADRGHIHHRLIQEGFDQRQAVLLIYGWTTVLCIGAVIMTQVELVPRIFIFFVLVTASGMFAAHLRLFEPVLRHHYDPRTGHDVLVTPDDPAFEEETERAQEEREEMLEGLHDLLLPHRDDIE